eukprot:COSAG02_NODE_23422_length_719_cov_1.133871_1_plen_24_part_01
MRVKDGERWAEGPGWCVPQRCRVG